jgi:hypothetical protein
LKRREFIALVGGAAAARALGVCSNFDEAISDRLAFVGRENILLGIC